MHANLFDQSSAGPPPSRTPLSPPARRSVCRAREARQQPLDDPFQCPRVLGCHLWPFRAGPRAPSQRYSKSYLFSLYVSLFHTIHIISNLLGHNPYEFSVPITPLPVTCTHRSGVQQVVFVFCICLSFLYYAQYCEPTVPQFLRVFSTSQTAATSRQLRDVRHSGVW